MLTFLFFVIAAGLGLFLWMRGRSPRDYGHAREVRYTRRSGPAPDSAFMRAAVADEEDSVVQKIDRLNPMRTATAPVRETKAVKQAKMQHFLSLYVMARPGQFFQGYELLQSLLACGLRHGQMDIFHFYEQQQGETKILFSVASAHKPGTFNLAEMGQYRCPGLSLFFSVEPQADPNDVFDKMLDTARQLAEDLEGELLDQHRKPLTEDSMDAYHLQIDKCSLGIVENV